MAVIKGEKVDALHTFGDLYVSLELNQTDPAAKNANSGKKQPEHYRNIFNQAFKNAVIVDNGSVVQFKIASRGLFGFGYRIGGGALVDASGRAVRDDKNKKKRDVIAKQLYCFGKEGNNAELTGVERGYQDHEASTNATSLIRIRNFPTLKINPDETDLQIALMTCTVSSWNVYGYIDGEDDTDYGMPLNIGEIAYGPRPPVQRPEMEEPKAFTVQSVTPVTAFGGAPTRFFLPEGTATQQFPQASLIREDDPVRSSNYVSFAFLVRP